MLTIDDERKLMIHLRHVAHNLNTDRGDLMSASKYAQAALDLGESEPIGYVTTRNGVSTAVRQPTGKMMHGKEMRVQLLYILENLRAWEGHDARHTKKFFKEVIKKLS